MLSNNKDKIELAEEGVKSVLSRSLAIVMGGGKGERLYPLTKSRAKPAVPLAGKYRIVDIPLSNCINSGLNDVYVLTQYNSVSLNRHINRTYKFDIFRKGFVEIFAAQQTRSGEQWFQGTADAVRQSLSYILPENYDYFAILSGDQLYRLNMAEIIAQHVYNKADITIATIGVDRERAKDFGIMKVDSRGKIIRFVEKSKNDEVLDEFDVRNVIKENNSQTGDKVLDGKVKKNISKGNNFLASMGIYIFNRQVLLEVLNNDLSDFGKHIIPNSIKTHKVYNYMFDGYWEDIGTIKSFYEANLGLTETQPQYNFFDGNAPIFTNPRFLPASKVNGAIIDHTLISDGCIITDATIRHSIIGVRSHVERGCKIERSVIMGSDYYETAEFRANHNPKYPPMGIGDNTIIKQAIVDKGARIGKNCIITPFGKDENKDGKNFCIRDGIVIIPRNAIIEDGTII